MTTLVAYLETLLYINVLLLTYIIFGSIVLIIVLYSKYKKIKARLNIEQLGYFLDHPVSRPPSYDNLIRQQQAYRATGDTPV